MNSRIALQNVDYIYQEKSPFKQKALESVDFSVEKGECVAVIGRTGSGKSTLIQHLNGLLFPTRGKVFVNGREILRKSDWRSFRSQVGIVFQNPEDQLFEKYVGDDVAFGPIKLGLKGSKLIERVRWALGLVGLPADQFLNRPVYALSGGQKRKAALAGVIAMKPNVLVLDEPTAGLDPFSRKELLENIRHLHENGEMSIVFVTHSMEEVSFLAEKVYVLEKGKIKFEGTPQQLFLSDDSRFEQKIALPDCVDLLRKLKTNGIAVDFSDFREQAVIEQVLQIAERQVRPCN